ncbi:tyrosine-protein kinase domain-containing protein [Botrimarina mediterranea]|uniref:Tyrosine-protein kinase ptk n=1 Tax=Botrimarina mediterranea TaxID=2528022 RepID=A0A518K3I5_9BACT|nr:polysaccharide biosynthesis tyrosine autokinase [Botrimarina mediterranea]QDV72368.1 Tyrosine-protein kinase ptk [Botrimarina mediterranea]QDV76914.1 Tyrosine-protein kinase ptk [Planctomycetes bacterium K2D]
MSQNENGNVASPQPGASLVATGPAATHLTAPGMHGPGFGQPVGAQGQDVLKGGMDRSGLFHALRRRWLLATSMSLLLASTVAGLLYWLFPETNSATAQYKVSSSPLTLMERGQNVYKDDYEIFKNTQLAYIKSPLVLMSALTANQAEISRLEMFNDADDQVEWLRNHLEVAFPSRGEIMEITLAGPHPKEDLKKVVEAVSKAYYDEVIFREQGERTLPLQILKGSLRDLSGKVRDKLETYKQLAKDSGTSEIYKGSFDPETELLLAEVREIQNREAKLRGELTEATTNYRILEAQINDPQYMEQVVDEMVKSDPMVAQMQQEAMYYQMQIRSLRSTVKRGTSAQIRMLEQQYQQAQQEIAQMKQQLQAQLSGQQSNEPNPYIKAALTEYQIKRQFGQAELAELNKRGEEIKQELLRKAESNTDLMLRLAEIDQLQAVEESIATKIQNLQVETQAPNRVQAIGQKGDASATAETFENRNRMMRYAISGLGGLTVLGLTCLGIGYMEFSSRRLNGPEQVDEGLGIRVIGTLPGLTGKRSLSAGSPILAQLSESIDSVRTALMHESTSKKRQLVLVTSPETTEGRTTVASQLAASLARAGRRTLLIDGDLRRPALHTLFNSPLEDGLCEVLRAEAEVSDVVRPTQAEGLWLMTAGYCDSDAIRALATDQVQPIFDKLRSDYDFIIIDGAPVLGLSDSLLFGQHCDGAILSVLRDRSCVTKIHQSVELLRSVGVRMVGAVVNGVSSKADRRVTHLQQVTPKSAQKKLEMTEV